jgi:hypothetical protein
MSVGYLTSDSLISAIKRKAMIPSNQNTFTDADFLAFANEELKIGLLPSILQLHEEFYVYPQTITLQANKSKYQIPYRSVGSKIRDLFYKDTNGNLVEMSRILPEDKSLYQQFGGNSNYLFYYIEGNNIVLTPDVGPSVNGSLVVTYYLRPSDLVAENRVAIITNITTDDVAGTTTYTVDGVPTGMIAGTSTLDLLQAKPGHKIRNFDIVAQNVNTINKTITFNTSDVDSETEIGDHIAFAGECMIPQCPSDLHAVLAQRVAARCLEALGDTQGLQNANAKLQEMELKTIGLIDNRAEGSPTKIVNRRGLLHGSLMRRRRWF